MTIRMKKLLTTLLDTVIVNGDNDPIDPKTSAFDTKVNEFVD